MDGNVLKITELIVRVADSLLHICLNFLSFNLKVKHIYLDEFQNQIKTYKQETDRQREKERERGREKEREKCRIEVDKLAEIGAEHIGCFWRLSFAH